MIRYDSWAHARPQVRYGRARGALGPGTRCWAPQCIGHQARSGARHRSSGRRQGFSAIQNVRIRGVWRHGLSREQRGACSRRAALSPARVPCACVMCIHSRVHAGGISLRRRCCRVVIPSGCQRLCSDRRDRPEQPSRCGRSTARPALRVLCLCVRVPMPLAGGRALLVGTMFGAAGCFSPKGTGAEHGPKKIDLRNLWSVLGAVDG